MCCQNYFSSYRLIPVPMVGFKELLRRLKAQDQMTKQHQTRLDVSFLLSAMTVDKGGAIKGACSTVCYELKRAPCAWGCDSLSSFLNVFLN